MTNEAPAQTQWIEKFRLWLETDVKYRPRTVTKVVGDLRTMLLHKGMPPTSVRSGRVRDFQWAWDLWSDFSLEKKAPRLRIARPEAPPTGRRRRRKEAPTYLAESIEAGQWRALRTVVEADKSFEAAIIAVLMSSGLRISDVLRSPPRAIEDGLAREDGIARIEVKGGKTIEIPVRGGAEKAWSRLLIKISWQHWLVPGKPRHFADVLVGKPTSPEAGGAAYQRVRAALFELGEKAGVTGRVHLHRLRRTVGVRLLEANVPIETVQKVFGHSSLRTTQGYTSESMARMAGEALRKINR